MQHFSTSLHALFTSLWRNRDLIFGLAKRDVISRYRGSTIGILWSFFNPVLMLSVYTFVFGVIFQARWGQAADDPIEFALILFAGLIVFNLFSECVNRAPTLILNNTNYVKRVIFPLEILPWVLLASALFHAVVSLGVWLIFCLLFLGVPPLSIAVLPLLLLPFLLVLAGVGWLLASLGVYIRDIGQVVGILVTALLFLSPIFYPMSALPAQYRLLLYLNPLTYVVEATRGVLIWGNLPEWRLYLVYSLLSIVVAWCGFYLFQRTRRGFADVI